MPSIRQLAITSLGALLLVGNAAATASAQDRLYATPQLSGQNPYQPSEVADRKLPVALRGFSVVALRDQQLWLPGQEHIQLIFDGQIYWFAGARDCEIFAAAPHDYAPVLGGDCVVTFVDTGERVVGKAQFGLLHRGRLYFFAGDDERIRFQSDPSHYASGDLAHGGRCIVSQVDEHKSIAGLPATVATVGGLRYLFAGDYQRRLFGADLGRYGVERVLGQGPESESSAGKQAPPQDSAAADKNASQSLDSSDEEEDAEDQICAMEGYCPVTIQTQGAWVRGSFQNHFDFEEQHYLFVGEKELKLFGADPGKYAPVLRGNCIVTKVDKGKLAPGSVYHSLVYEGRLYMFAGPEQVKAFKADPAKYAEPATPSEKAEPPVTPPQEEDAAAMRDSENSLRSGRRSEFSRRNPNR